MLCSGVEKRSEMIEMIASVYVYDDDEKEIVVPKSRQCDINMYRKSYYIKKK